MGVPSTSQTIHTACFASTCVRALSRALPTRQTPRRLGATASRYRGGIIAVQNGVEPARIVQIVLNAAGDSVVRLDVIDRNSNIADEPSIGTVFGDDFIYVANGQWTKYDDNGKRIAGSKLSPTILLDVPLRHLP